ncbi:MAG: dihydroorotate dehydrogenase electron transfer subunit [Chloroflexi bacterium]|nr:dihydroorotate dehydrogenase electron transfer subunit [Chloroflexota bacterium]
MIEGTASKVREHICTVISNEPVNDQYNHLILAAPKLALQAEPGQFFHLLCPLFGEQTPFLRRPMSVYRIDRDNGRLSFLYKIVGVGTTAMSTLEPGDSFNVFGPLGRGFWLEPAWQNLLIVARGVGLATLAPLSQSAHRSGRRLFAICSARSPAYLLSVEYFEELGATVFPLVDSDGSSGVTAVEKLIRALIERQGIDAIFICGSNRLLKLLQKLGREYNLPGQVALEQQMACGLGMCYCCVRTFVQDGKQVDRRVCKEGPVFNLQEAMAW